MVMRIAVPVTARGVLREVALSGEGCFADWRGEDDEDPMSEVQPARVSVRVTVTVTVRENTALLRCSRDDDAGWVIAAGGWSPAGLLPQIAAGLATTQATVGQLVSAYALGTIVATMPLIARTRAMRRKPVFLSLVLASCWPTRSRHC